MERPTIRHAALIAQCLGRGELAPLAPEDVEALAVELDRSHHAGGAKVFAVGDVGAGVWIVRPS